MAKQPNFSKLKPKSESNPFGVTPRANKAGRKPKEKTRTEKVLVNLYPEEMETLLDKSATEDIGAATLIYRTCKNAGLFQ